MKKEYKDKIIYACVAFVLLIGVIITYSNHFNNDFHFDDSHTINNNIYIRDLHNFTKFFTSVETFGSMPSNRGYRPIVTASTAIDFAIAKKDPFGINKEKKYAEGLVPFYYHLPMFLLYLLQGVLMFFMFLKIFNISFKHNWNIYLVFFSVGLYMLHPGNAETINYMVSRSDSYSTLLMLLGFILYIFSPFCRKWWIYIIPVLLGMLAKESAVVFPLLLFAYIYLFEKKLSITGFFKKANGKALGRTVLAVLPSLIICFIASQLMQKITFAQTGLSPMSHSDPGSIMNHIKYVWTQPYVLMQYFGSYFLPINLSSDSDLESFSSFFNLQAHLGLIFVILMFWMAFITSKKEQYRPIAFGILWFFIASIPTSILVPLTQVATSHRLFLPYIGLTISVCWAIYLFVIKIAPVFKARTFQIWLTIILIFVLFGYASGTYERNNVWRSEESLWYDMTLKSPKNPRVLMNYGLTQMTSGNYPVAEYYFLRALQIWPRWSYLHINLGVLKSAQGQKEEAEKYFQNAIAYGGNLFSEPYYYYARFLSERKDYDKAISNLRMAIQISRADIQARDLLMAIYADRQDWDLLAQLANETLQIAPGDKDSQNYLAMSQNKKTGLQLNEDELKKSPTPEGYLELSLQYYYRSNYQKCVDAANDALKLRPDYAEAYNNICCAYNAMEKWDEAIVAGEKAVKLNPNYQLAKNNLAAARNGKAKQGQK